MKKKKGKTKKANAVKEVKTSVKTETAEDPKAQKVLDFLTEDTPTPFGGLDVERKAKHYKHKRLCVPNELVTQDEKTATKKLLYKFIVRKQSFDPRKNRVGLRTLRTTEQWEDDYEFGEKIKVETESRSVEDTVENPEEGKTYWIDYQTSNTSIKSSEEVKCVAVKDTNVLIKDKKGNLYYTKARNLKDKPIGTIEKKVIVGKVKPSVYRLVGMRFGTQKETINTHVEGELYSARVQVAFAINFTNAVKPREKELNDTTLGHYTIADETKLLVVPARVFVKFINDGKEVEFYILLLREKNTSSEPTEAYTLCDFFIEKKKKKKNKKSKADLNKAVIEAVEDDEDDEEDEL